MAKSIACLLVVLLGRGCSFVPRLTQHHVMLAHYSTADPQIFLPTALDLTLLKSDLVKLCCRSPKASLKELQTMVQEVEGMGEQVCLPFLNIVVMDGPEHAPIDAASDLFASLCFSLVLDSVLPATDFSLESGECVWL